MQLHRRLHLSQCFTRIIEIVAEIYDERWINAVAWDGLELTRCVSHASGLASSFEARSRSPSGKVRAHNTQSHLYILTPFST